MEARIGCSREFTNVFVSKWRVPYFISRRASPLAEGDISPPWIMDVAVFYQKELYARGMRIFLGIIREDAINHRDMRKYEYKKGLPV